MGSSSGRSSAGRLKAARDSVTQINPSPCPSASFLPAQVKQTLTEGGFINHSPCFLLLEFDRLTEFI